MYSPLITACLDCEYEAPYVIQETQCPRCGNEWREVRYDYDTLGSTLLSRLVDRPFDLWRYHELLPVNGRDPLITMGEGGTPLIPAVNLGTMLGLSQLYIKDERQGPTASFKDRQGAVSITAMKEAGITEAVLASTGNVALSYSAYAVRAGIKLWVFFPSMVPGEKLREVALYGTQVTKVNGSYDQAKRAAAEFARQRGLYLERGSRSAPSIESFKTIAFEIAEQLTALYGPPTADQHPAPWRVPDWYFQSVSGGIGPLGVHKGFTELYKMGLTNRIPAIACIQAEGCSPMVKAWKRNASQAEAELSPHTRITTLATGDPGRAYNLLYERIKTDGGVFESVPDEDTFQMMHILAKREGISVESAAAVTFSGLIKLARNGQIEPNEVVVVNCTGHTMSVEETILQSGTNGLLSP